MSRLAVGMHCGLGPLPFLLCPDQGQRSGPVEPNLVPTIIHKVDVTVSTAHSQRNVHVWCVAPTASANDPCVQTRCFTSDLASFKHHDVYVGFGKRERRRHAHDSCTNHNSFHGLNLDPQPGGGLVNLTF